MFGLAGLIAFGVGYDLYAKVSRRQTISGAVWQLERSGPGWALCWASALIGAVHLLKRYPRPTRSV